MSNKLSHAITRTYKRTAKPKPLSVGDRVALTEESRYRFAKTCKAGDGQYRGCAGQVIPARNFERIYLGEVGTVHDVGGTGRVLVSWPSFPLGAWCDRDILDEVTTATN